MEAKARGRRSARLVSTLAAATLAGLTAVPSASAHAVLLRTEPGNDSVLQRQPSRIVLRFSEPVETAFGSVRVYDSDARRVDDGRVRRSDEESVAVRLDRDLAGGTYTVTWRAISADAHPVSGAFVFHVGAPGTNPAGIAAQVLEAGTSRSVTVLFTTVRFLDFALLLAVAGGTAALALVLGAAHPPVRRTLFVLLSGLSAALVVVALAGIVLQGAAAGGYGVTDAARWDSVSAVLETRFGKVWVAQAVLAGAVAVIAFAALRLGRRTLRVALPLALANLLTPALSGHASVSGGLSLTADVVHLTAAAAWTGGLAFLVVALVLAREDRWPLAARAVPRFSTLALVSVTALVVAGSVNGYLQVQAWRGLWETTYGILLLAKVGIVLPLLALGAYNNRFAVPKLRREIASRVEQRRFLRAAGAELGLMIAVVSVTAVLVAEPPARASVAPTGPYATTAQLGPLSLNLVVDPAEAGANSIHLFLLDRAGRPTDPDELRLSATLPSKEIGPLRFTAHRLAPGHFAVHGAHFTIAGDWQLRLDARRGEFEALTQTISIPIRKDS